VACRGCCPFPDSTSSKKKIALELSRISVKKVEITNL
jgi:hypothetical protein